MDPLPSVSFKAAVITSKGYPLALKDIRTARPSMGEVLVKVLACGVCHSDAVVRDGYLLNTFPRTPNHEIVGDIVAVGTGVTRFGGGERVTTYSAVPISVASFNGVTRDGGYAEYVLLRKEAVVRVPKDLDPANVAPLFCAGVTVFNGMRRLHVEAGGLVAIRGIGGLGHLAIQFARVMGYKTVALSHGERKRTFAMELSAHEYIDASKEDPVKKLAKLGGANMICATAPNAEAIGPLIVALEPGGKLLLLAAAGQIASDTIAMINGGLSLHGWASGYALDSKETIAFAHDHGLRCTVEKFPLSDVNKAFDHMLSGDVRFRAVLVPQ